MSNKITLETIQKLKADVMKASPAHPNIVFVNASWFEDKRTEVEKLQDAISGEDDHSYLWKLWNA